LKLGPLARVTESKTEGQIRKERHLDTETRQSKAKEVSGAASRRQHGHNNKYHLKVGV